MDKIVISCDLADAIEKIRHMELSDIIECHVKIPTGWSYEALNGIPLDTLVKALVIGYEIEKTPEDMVREAFRDVDSYGDMSQRIWVKGAIVHTLDLLGIKIEGVNA